MKQYLDILDRILKEGVKKEGNNILTFSTASLRKA